MKNLIEQLEELTIKKGKTYDADSVRVLQETAFKLLPTIIRQLKVKKIHTGMLRQWLNEDRITDPKKMVTNKDIEDWLKIE